jgi:uncharacterized Rmd1/YagE family protein
LDRLRNQLEVRHATRLEWIIIWLIVIEVLLEVCWNIAVKVHRLNKPSTQDSKPQTFNTSES